MEEVKQTNAIPDIRQRNRVISGSYARLYQSAPELKWAGAAAFASKQVGCGMDSAASYLDDYPGGIEAAVRDNAMTGGAGLDPISTTMHASREALGEGNLSVYNELYPALRFYQQNKSTMSKQQIMHCMEHKPGEPLPPRVRAGLEQTMNGQGTRGALTMLRHEQEITLQSMYDRSWPLRRGLDMSRLTGWPAARLVFNAGCGSADAAHTVDFADYGSRWSSRMYNFQDRWPFAQDAAGRFVSLSQFPATGPGINQALEQIARAGGR